ncbi:3-ketoacyl-CoA thiolase [Streptomyces tanashiensis]
MTGARITGTLINSLQFHDKQWGLETMCVGGGQGMAMVMERAELSPRPLPAEQAVRIRPPDRDRISPRM